MLKEEWREGLRVFIYGFLTQSHFVAKSEYFLQEVDE